MSPAEIPIHDRVRELLNNQSFMTIATKGESGLWSASVYYVFLMNRLYFFSSTNSAHMGHVAADPRVAASIAHDGDFWQQLKGLQIRGIVSDVTEPAEKAVTIRAYLKKFPFIKEFMKEYVLNTAHFSKRMEGMELFKLEPTEMVYMDNSQGFGFREPVTLPLV